MMTSKLSPMSLSDAEGREDVAEYVVHRDRPGQTPETVGGKSILLAPQFRK